MKEWVKWLISVLVVAGVFVFGWLLLTFPLFLDVTLYLTIFGAVTGLTILVKLLLFED